MVENIKLDLGIQNVQLILNALGNMPYGQVENLVADIRKQATEQIDAQKNDDEAA